MRSPIVEVGIYVGLVLLGVAGFAAVLASSTATTVVLTVVCAACIPVVAVLIWWKRGNIIGVVGRIRWVWRLRLLQWSIRRAAHLKIPSDLTGDAQSSLRTSPAWQSQKWDNFATTVPAADVPTWPVAVSDISDIGTAKDFLAAVDKAIKYFNNGDIVEGIVVRVDRDEVLLDIGYKTEGVIPSRELSMKYDVDPAEEVDVGDMVKAVVLKNEDKDGRLILSRKRALYLNHSDSPSCDWPAPSDSDRNLDNGRHVNEAPVQAAVLMRLIDSWARIEESVPKSVTDKFYWLEVHTNVRMRKLRFAKGVRNRVVHGRRTNVKDNDIEQAQRILDDAIRNLRARS